MRYSFFKIAALRAFEARRNFGRLHHAPASGQSAAFRAGVARRPIRLIVASAPAAAPTSSRGSSRRRWANTLGQPVVVENRPGAGGTIAAHQVATAPADGYTRVFLLNNGHAVSAAMYKALPYDAGGRLPAGTMRRRCRWWSLPGPKAPYADLQALIAVAGRVPAS
jgi:hypothetical protein